MTAVPAGGTGADVLVPHWLTGTHRARLTAVVQEALTDPGVHPVVAIRLEDVLTELHVAAARDAVWPASAARVRLATGWDADVLPVRLSLAEVTAVLSLCALPDGLRDRLTGTVR